ncbi:HNH endonuclease signature motif containing protein [Glaciibacter flavus]|uniref:HNH endonuclease signature motif containing protein n=1 Tax=Orlajensenia flava TaxID=2565934 RepID=UPI003B0023DB
MSTTAAVFAELTEVLTMAGVCASTFQTMAEEELADTHRQMGCLRDEVDRAMAFSAAEVARRSRPVFGDLGMARRTGARNDAEMLQKLTGGSRRDARRMIAVGQMMAEAEVTAGVEDDGRAEAGSVAAPAWFSALGRAVAAGELTVDQAASVRGGLGEPDAAVDDQALAAALPEIIALARDVNADAAFTAARRFRERLDTAGVAGRAEARRAKQFWRMWPKPDGMYRGEFELDPENGAYLKDVYDQLTSPRRGGPRWVNTKDAARDKALRDDPRSTERIAVEGLVRLVELGVSADPAVMPGLLPSTRKPAVRVITMKRDLERAGPARRDDPTRPDTGSGFGHLEGSDELIPLADARAAICDSGVLPVLFDEDGRALDVGREQRLFTTKQRVALAIRDGGCLWPGCDRPPSWCEAHHIDEWVADLGRTDVADGVLLCRYHHLLLHNAGWRIQRIGAAGYVLHPPASVDIERRPIALRARSLIMVKAPVHPPPASRLDPPDRPIARDGNSELPGSSVEGREPRARSA